MDKVCDVTKYVGVKVSKRVYEALKERCAENGTSIQRFVEALIIDTVLGGSKSELVAGEQE